MLKTKTGGCLIAVAGFLFALAAFAFAFAQSVSLSILNASVVTDRRTNQRVLSIELPKESARAFGELTRNNVGRKTELRLDGKVLSAPVIREPILGGKLQIAGDEPVIDFEEIAKRLRSGGLVEVVIVPQ
jgi:preprotein translocase subunit SecD